jgi:hypothetical protein
VIFVDAAAEQMKEPRDLFPDHILLVGGGSYQLQAITFSSAGRYHFTAAMLVDRTVVSFQDDSKMRDDRGWIGYDDSHGFGVVDDFPTLQLMHHPFQAEFGVFVRNNNVCCSNSCSRFDTKQINMEVNEERRGVCQL